MWAGLGDAYRALDKWEAAKQSYLRAEVGVGSMVPDVNSFLFDERLDGAVYRPLTSAMCTCAHSASPKYIGS